MSAAKKRRDRRREERARRSVGIARLVRRSCSSCGSPRLWWGDVEQATMRQGASHVQEALAWLGRDGGPETQFWGCEDCGDGGAFGLVHEDWLDALSDRVAGGPRTRPPV